MMFGKLVILKRQEKIMSDELTYFTRQKIAIGTMLRILVMHRRCNFYGAQVSSKDSFLFPYDYVNIIHVA